MQTEKERKAQQAKSFKAYYEKNKESLLAQKREYKKAKSEEIKEQRKEYRKRNRDVTKAAWDKWYEENKEFAILKAHDRRMFLTTGWTIEAYDIQFNLQEGKCVICGLTSIRRLSADHEYVSPAFPRELLCHVCNMALGGFKDNPELLRKAADYIEKHRERRING